MSITNHWQEEHYLNKGGYSEVYRVKLHGKYYALKKIFPSVLKNTFYRQNIQRQINIMQSLDHPKIIKLHRAIVQDDQISLLLEYAEGGSLYDLLKTHGKLPEQQVKQYVKDVIEALQYLHKRENPILHRDIKPQNLLISRDHHCKLADFGSANILDGQRLSYVGTADYMAPEVIECQPHGVPYDIWSLGILIYELLTGKVPESEISYPSFLSRSSQDVIKKLLVKDPSKRMTLNELRQHIWLYDQHHNIRIQSSQNIDKMLEMKKKIKEKLKSESLQLKSFSSDIQPSKKQRSILQENQDVNRKANEYILLLKQREKLKEQIMKNDKIIQKQERRRRGQRPFLLQEIDRLKCVIREYENNISILKARPLKMQAYCKHNVQLLGKRVEDLSEYVEKLPQRIKVDMLYFPNYQPSVEVFPISQYVLKQKTQMLLNHRGALLQFIASKRTHKEIYQMIQIHSQFHMADSIQEVTEETRSPTSLNGKQKTL